MIYEGDVIHHFKATLLSYVTIAITFVPFHSTVRGTHKTVCEIRDCKKKTQTSRAEKKLKK